MSAVETRAHVAHVQEAAPAFRAEIDLPPSTNNLFATRGRRRVATAAYRAWRMAAGWECRVAGFKPISGPYRLTVMVPTKARADVDNYLKAVGDLVVSLGITPDDKHAVSVHAERSACVQDGRCRIEVRAA